MPSAYQLPPGGVNRAARWARPFNRHANGVGACSIERFAASRALRRSPLGLRLNMPTALSRAETVLSNVDAECVRTASRRVSRAARRARPFNRHANGVFAPSSGSQPAASCRRRARWACG